MFDLPKSVSPCRTRCPALSENICIESENQVEGRRDGYGNRVGRDLRTPFSGAATSFWVLNTCNSHNTREEVECSSQEGGAERFGPRHNAPPGHDTQTVFPERGFFRATGW
jgi:hypothetical protein